MRKEIIFLFLLVFCLSTCPLFGQNNQQGNSNELNEKEFIEKYEKWLPERIVSAPRSTSENPPVPDISKNLDFFGEVYKQKNKNNRLCRLYFQCYEHAINADCPFPNLIKQLVEINYALNISDVPLYSIFPLLGRFYCIDCPAGREEDNVWIASIYRLKQDELPKDIKLQNESIIFTINSELQKKYGDHSGYLYSYRVFVTDIEKINQDKGDLHAKIKVIGYGSRQIVREGWYKIGDVIEFSHFSHKITNIVAPRDLNKEIQGHKCNLIGYVELDPEAVPLEKPKLEEIEFLPDPPEPSIPEPELTNEEKTEMRTWKLIYPENKIFEIQAAFIRIENEGVTLRKPDTKYERFHLKNFSESDRQLIQSIIEQRKKYSTENGIKFELIPLAPNPTFGNEEDDEQNTLLQVIGEKIEIALKIKNISNDIISICKAKLWTNNSYNVLGGTEFIKSVFNRKKPVPILFNQKDWLTLSPNEEYVYPISQNKFASWQLPRYGEKINFSQANYYIFSFDHDKLDLPLEMRKKLVESGVSAKIYIGKEYNSDVARAIQFYPPPIERKELLLPKIVKYIERTFTKAEVEEILKFNGGVDIYSDNAKDMIKTFLQTYTLAANELEELLIANVMIDGFERQEFIYRRLGMFGTDTAKQARDKMQVAAREKYKKELTDAVVEDEMTNEDTEDLPDTTTSSEPSPQSSPPQPTTKSITQSTAIYFVLSFILLFLVIIVTLIYRRKR
jgi:hypothetical protein